MKLFKLANSKEVQEKAFKLGYLWKWKEDEHSIDLEKPYLFLCGDGDINSETDLDIFIEDPATAITTGDFLKIPDPKKSDNDIKIEELQKKMDEISKEIEELKG